MSELSPKPEKDSRFTRRTAIKIGSTALALLAGARILNKEDLLSNAFKTPTPKPKDTVTDPPSPVDIPIELPQLDQDRLHEAGLNDFKDVFHSFSIMQTKFGTVLDFFPLDNGSGEAHSLYSTLRDVTKRGQVTSGEKTNASAVAEIRDKWGDQRENIDVALQRANTSHNFQKGGTSDTREEVIAYLDTIGRILPYHVLTLPEDITTVKGAGGLGKIYEMPTLKYDEFYRLRPSNERTAFSLLHEGQHTIESDWHRVKPYIDRKQYLDYIQTVTDQTMYLAESYFSLPWNEAAVFMKGKQLLPHSPRLDEIQQLQSRFAKYGIKFPDLDITSDTSTALNATIHALGKKRLEIIGSKGKGIAITELDNAFLEDSGVSDQMQFLLGELGHILKGPYLSEDMILPFDKPAENTDKITKAIYTVQQARLKAFSTKGELSPRELRSAVGLLPERTGERMTISDYESLYYKIQEKLGPDFSRIFAAAHGLQERYGYTPSMHYFATENYPADNFYTFCRALGMDDKNPHVIKTLNLLRDGWGEKVTNRDAEAISYTASVAIDTSRTGDLEEDARAFLRRVANTLPVYMLALPKDVRFLPGGGNASTEYINLTTPKKIEDAVVTFFHEGSHEIEMRWQAVKQYVTREAYTTYVASVMEGIKATADAYYSLPWDEAKKFSNGSTMILYGGIDLNETVRIEKLFPDYQKTLTELDPSRVNNASYRRNRLAHYVGQKLKNIHESNTSVDLLPQTDKEFLSRPETHLLAQELLDELQHYFVGPVQRRDGGLPVTSYSIADTESILTQTNIAIQKARLNAFSSLPEDATFEQLRASLGLPTR